METDKNLLPDFLIAISIMAVMFVFMIYVDTAVSVEPESYQPECHDMYQLTTKEVLSCE